jgi:hypothetical protein
MKWTSWPFLAEYEMNAGVDRLSIMILFFILGGKAHDGEEHRPADAIA